MAEGEDGVRVLRLCGGRSKINMNGWEKYGKLILDEMNAVMLPQLEADREQFAEVLGNRFFNRDGPTTMEAAVSAREGALVKIFWGYSEIARSHEILSDIEVYIGSFSVRNSRISRLRYLKYHIENYYNEVYILKQRMIANLTIIGRLYRGTPLHRDVLIRTRPMFGSVRDYLEPIVRVRGGHVHSARFDSEDLTRLDLIELIRGSEIREETSLFLKNYLAFEYKNVRRKIKRGVKDNNRAILRLLDHYGDKLLSIISDPANSNLIYPE